MEVVVWGDMISIRVGFFLTLLDGDLGATGCQGLYCMYGTPTRLGILDRTVVLCIG